MRIISYSAADCNPSLKHFNHEIHEVHEKVLRRLAPQSASDTLDFHPWVMTEIDKQSKFHVCSPKIVV